MAKNNTASTVIQLIGILLLLLFVLPRVLASVSAGAPDYSGDAGSPATTAPVVIPYIGPYSPGWYAAHQATGTLMRNPLQIVQYDDGMQGADYGDMMIFSGGALAQ
jgi:hypothetical protein